MLSDSPSPISNIYKFLLPLLCFIPLLPGCRPPPLPASFAPPPPQTQPAPTTRDLANEPTSPLQLTYVPVTLRVVNGWSVTHEAGTPILQGPIPHVINDDTATIAMGPPQSVTESEYQTFLRGAQIEMQRNPGRFVLSGPTRVGPITILDERQFPRANTTLPASRPANYSPLVIWRIWLFVSHRPGEYDRYSLSFLALDLNTYNANRDFLQKLINSIQYDPANDAPF